MPGLPRPIQIRRSATYFPELESLRGIAILLVVVFHAATFGRSLAGTWVSPLAAFAYAGHTGVSLFFVLSAFLLSRPFLAQAAGGRRVRIRDFYRRRALRILPLYWTAVIFAAVASAHQVKDLLACLPSLVFLNQLTAWRPLPYGAVWWSLVTEAQFYVLLPLLPLALGSRRGRRVGALVFLAWAAAYGAFLARLLPIGDIPAIVLDQSVFGLAPVFLAGILAAWVYTRHGEALRTRLAGIGWLSRGGADALLVATLAGLSLLLRLVVHLGTDRMNVPPWAAWHVAEGMLWTTVLLLLLVAPLRSKRLLSNPVLAALGIISYSLYLVHYPIVFHILYPLESPPGMHLASWDLPTLAAVGGAIVLSVAVSTATYWLIERPFLVRKARLDR